MNLFSILTKFLVIFLPFYVIIKVFFEYKLWINYFWFFIKELVIVALFLSLVYEFIKKKIKPKFELLDYLIFAYFWYWILITLINWYWLNSIIFGWRYDFIFLVVFLILRHWKQFLKINTAELFKSFIFSWTIALFLWIMIKFILWEETLVFFGYNYYVANWSFSWSIPIYHWVENSWIRRFQWLLDWPNQMWFFLILFSWIVLHLTKRKMEFHMILVYIILFWLVLFTYSRSALLWIFSALWFIFLLNIKTLFKTYKKQMLLALVWLSVIMWIFLTVYERKIHNIFIRAASTAGHFERMEIWINKFLEKPFGHWLATSGPAYRSVFTDKNSKEDEKEFIPESWFIQQLVEWWFIYFLLFISILWIILKRLYKVSIPMFWALFAILVINVFLHIFEATYLSILLFIFIGILLSKNYKESWEI